MRNSGGPIDSFVLRTSHKNLKKDTRHQKQQIIEHSHRQITNKSISLDVMNALLQLAVNQDESPKITTTTTASATAAKTEAKELKPVCTNTINPPHASGEGTKQQRRLWWHLERKSTWTCIWI